MTTRRAFAWAFSGQFANFAIGFAGSVIVTKLLTPYEVGIYTIAAAALGLVTAFTSFGLSSYLVREKELTPETRNTAFTVNALLSLGIAAVTVGVGALSELLLKSPEARGVLYMLALTPLIGIVSFGPISMLQREFQFKQLSLINTLATLCGTAVTVASALYGLGYMSPAWGTLTSSVATLIGYAIIGRRHIPFRFSVRGWRPITTFGMQMLTITGAATMTFRLSDIMLGRLLGLDALGVFSRASNLSNQIFYNVYGSATHVVFTKLSQDYRDTGQLKDSFINSYKMITAVMWPFLAVLAILSPVIIQTLYGERWLAAALPLTVLLVAQMVVLSFGMNWELFVVKGETGTQTRIELSRNIIGLVAFIAGCFVSIAAAAGGRVIDAIFGLVMYRSHVARLSGCEPSEFRRVYVEGALLVASGAWPVALLMTIEGWSANASLWLVALALLAGVACWLGMIFYRRHPLAHELKRISGRVLNR